jgi:phage gp46-like protein
MGTIRLENWTDIEELTRMSIGTDKGSWWANKNFGSDLWKIRQEGKVTPRTAGTIQRILQEALTWMKEDGIVLDIICSAERIGKNEIAYAITIFRPHGDSVIIKDTWNVIQ